MYGTDLSLLDALMIIVAALVTASASEALSWLLIYRTEDYQTLKKNIELLSKKVEKSKEQTFVASKQKAQDKKVARTEETLKAMSQQLSASKMKNTFIIAIFMIAVITTMNSSYNAQVMAKLPFEPFSLLQGMTHRGLPGNDPTDCSMIFIYVLSSYIIRADIQKYFQLSPKTSYSIWDPPK